MYHRNQCEVDGRVVQLSVQEADILSLLLASRGQTVTLPSILHALWPNPDREPESAEAVIYRVIYMLRRLLGPGVIFTVNKGLTSPSGYLIPRPGE
ncbi:MULTISPECIES: winged helix-turn-helix domain-containing protein [unclassified Sphingomonas]|nr:MULTISPECIES: helix-turn-helix domain-containing protein [unclassified Sphingomonas]KTF70682.1 hypothetical protein ATB93_18690 [Sphingomonas sp. WG]